MDLDLFIIIKQKKPTLFLKSWLLASPYLQLGIAGLGGGHGGHGVAGLVVGGPHNP